MQARQVAGPSCAAFCSGMGASVRASSATKGSPSVSVLGITKATTIRTQPRTRRPSAWPPRHARSPAAYTMLPRLTAAPIVQPSTSAWSSPPSCRPSTAIPRAPTAVSTMPAASRTRCWLGSRSRRTHGPPRRPSAQAIIPARKVYASSTTDRSIHWLRRNPGASAGETAIGWVIHGGSTEPGHPLPAAHLHVVIVGLHRPPGQKAAWNAAPPGGPSRIGEVGWRPRIWTGRPGWSQDDRMEATPRQVPSGSLGQTAPGALDVRRSGRRRRPTGQSPPLPRSIQPTGVWWAAAAVVLVTLAKVAFGPARRSLGVAVTVWDDAVVRWLAGLRLPGMTGLMEAIVASTGSVGVVGAVRWATLVALLALRRIRHLVVFVGSFLAVLLVVRLATVDRPRPFGMDIRGSWAGWAMPSRPVAIFAATLVGVLYTLVPVGPG